VFPPAAQPFLAAYLSSGVNITTTISAQPPLNSIIDAINDSTTTNINLNSNFLDPALSQNGGSASTTGALLETGTGHTIVLSPTPSPQSGTYTHIETGQTTLLSTDVVPDPGIYLSADQATVVVVLIDEITGKLMYFFGASAMAEIAAGLASGNVKIRRAPNCV
jgi:hypothetical protein